MPTLYRSPNTSASLAVVDALLVGDVELATQLERIANQPQAIWVGVWEKDPRAIVDAAVTAAVAARQLCALVCYAVPNLDCGSYSAGGAKDTEAFWLHVSAMALGIDRRKAMVLLEPDSTAHVKCLDAEALRKRLSLLSASVSTLTAAGARVYVDAGSYNWVPAADMVPRLIAAGIEKAAGFSLNVSDSETTENGVKFARELQAAILAATGKDAHFVIDVSRNGAGPPGVGDVEAQWCNPPSLRIGKPPTLRTGIVGCDGLLWVKHPGESDGECGGGPPAGDWWPEGARRLLS